MSVQMRATGWVLNHVMGACCRIIARADMSIYASMESGCNV